MTPYDPNIKRYENVEPDQSLDVPPRDERIDAALDAAICAHLGPSPMVFHEILSQTVHLDLMRHVPPGRGQAVVMTRGVSDKATTPPEGIDAYRWIELFVRVSEDWPVGEEGADEATWWPFRWLKQLGRFVHDYKTWFADLHTVPNGDPPEPFMEGSSLCGWLLCRPEDVDAPLARIDAAGRVVDLLELVPITAEEMRFKLAQGGEALRERLRAAGVLGKPIVPRRASTVSAEEAGQAEASPADGEQVDRAGFRNATRQALLSTREAYRERQRRLGWFDRWRDRISPPGWMPRDDGLRQIYADQWELRREGEVRWGHIVQANQLLFRPGRDDCPAAALWSPDPYYDGHLDELADLAGGLFEVKGEATGDPALQRFADLLADEEERQMRLKLPTSLTGGRTVFYTSIMVHRRHLPVPVLLVPFFPLLVPASDGVATMILPAREWSPPMTMLWLALAKGAMEGDGNE